MCLSTCRLREACDKIRASSVTSNLQTLLILIRGPVKIQSRARLISVMFCLCLEHCCTVARNGLETLILTSMNSSVSASTLRYANKISFYGIGIHADALDAI